MISIVIPVHNNASALNTCLERIFSQEFDLPYEVIVVDNNSSDNIDEVLINYKNIRRLNFTDYLSPYPCRNLGIKSARYSYLAIIDAKCFPCPGWLKAGFNKLINTNADVVIGPINHLISTQNDFFQISSKIMFPIISEDLKNGGFPFGSVFSKKSTFDKFGYLPENIRSNGDSIWSRSFISKGGIAIYENSAVVEYMSKRRRDLLSQGLRIGYGNRGLYKSKGEGNIHIFLKALWNMRLPSYFDIKNRCVRNKINGDINFLIKVMLAVWAYKIYLGFGRMGFKKILSIRSD